MLSISVGSICDVCLEPYDRDSRIPTSILCGHVFCLGCINSLRITNQYPHCPDIDNGAPCPLCRVRFDARSMTRLHVDFDSVRNSNSPPGPLALPADTEARKFHEAFAALTREGITEQDLRQLLDEAKAFLLAHSRDQFQDLRVLHHVIAYLCETKSKLRDQKVNHDKELIHLQDEKDALKRDLSGLSTKRTTERQAAVRVEQELRDYCKSLQGAYESMIRHYNFLVDEWQKLTEENERLRAKQYDSLRISANPSASDLPSPTASFTFDTFHREHEIRFLGTAATDPQSFAISPLPGLTGILPPNSPLPALGDDDATGLGYSGPPALSQRAQDHMARSHPVDIPRAHVISPAGQTDNRSASFTGPAAAPESSSAPAAIPMVYSLHDTISRYSTRVPPVAIRSTHRHSHTRPSVHSTSQPPSPSGSPALFEGASDTCVLQTTTTGSSPSSQVPNLNNRLQDLLQDTPVTTSSSLPNMLSCHIPSPPAREFHHPRESDRSPVSHSPSRSRPAVPLDTSPAKPERDVLPTSGTSEPPAPRPKPLVPDLSNGPISTASMAAQAAEKAKQERRRAEQEAEKERRKGEAEKENRRRVETDRSRAPVIPSSGPLHSGISSSLHPPTSYQQPTYSASSSYASQRAATGSLGRSATNPYNNADKHTSKAVPIAGRL